MVTIMIIIMIKIITVIIISTIMIIFFLISFVSKNEKNYNIISHCKIHNIEVTAEFAILESMLNLQYYSRYRI